MTERPEEHPPTERDASGPTTLPYGSWPSPIRIEDLVGDVVRLSDPWLDGDQWLLGKSMAGFCPVGPWLVTRDELAPEDPALLVAPLGERDGCVVHLLVEARHHAALSASSPGEA